MKIIHVLLLNSLRSSWKEIMSAQRCPHTDVIEMRDPQEQQEIDLAESAVQKILRKKTTQRLKQRKPTVPHSDLKLLKNFLPIAR